MPQAEHLRFVSSPLSFPIYRIKSYFLPAPLGATFLSASSNACLGFQTSGEKCSPSSVVLLSRFRLWDPRSGGKSSADSSGAACSWLWLLFVYPPASSGWWNI